MRHIKLIALLVSLLCGSSFSTLAQNAMRTPAKTANAGAPQLQFEKYKLKNGLEVIFSEDHRLPLVAVNLWYHVGPANERPGRTGFAHLFEHMMFQGSKHIPDDAHFKLLEGSGASDINGTTDFDRTNYFETLPSNQLELALWLESDRMGYLLDTLDEKKLANQRDVVRNERRQSIENQPYGLVDEEIFHQLYPQGHPYYASVIGSHADIEAARLNDVRDFFKQYYTPNNASIAIVGDINKEQVKALVEKYFGPIQAGPAVPPLDVKTPAITAERRVVVQDQIELPRVYMAWQTAPIYKPGDAEADLLARILGGGKSSRLYKRLVYEKQIAQDVTAQQYSLILGSVFFVQATAKPGVKPEDLEKAIDAELDAMRREGPTPSEVERARNTIETGIVRGLETLGGFGGVADRLNQYNHYLGNPDYLAADLARYRQATPDAVKKVAAEKLTNNARVVVYGVPGTKKINDVPKTAETAAATPEQPAASSDAAQDWRNKQPAAGQTSQLSLPVPKVLTLPNGLTVFLAERHNLPVVSANLVVLSGSETNPLKRPGTASFTADMLDEGTERRPALQLADDVAQIGASLAATSSSDASSITIGMLKKNVDAAFDLMSDVALHPAFPQKELDRVRNTRLTQILQQRDNPNVLATKVFNNAVYGDSHPYGYTELGTEESNKTITRDELVKFWQGGYAPKNAALVVAGDMSEAELRALATKYFGGWSGNAAAREKYEVSAPAARRIIIVDKPGSPQTALRIGQVGLPRSSEDYVPVEVMNTELGGLFSSRINMNLREKNGYTYGAGSRFIFRRGPGPFFVGTGVRTDVTAPAIKEVFGELDRMRTTQVSDDELRTAKDFFARSLPGLFETTSRAADTIAQIFIYNLPRDYYSTLPAKIQLVMAGDIKRVASKYLTPDKMVVVAVGDRAKIEPEIKKLSLGAVEARDLEGKPVAGQ